MEFIYCVLENLNRVTLPFVFVMSVFFVMSVRHIMNKLELLDKEKEEILLYNSTRIFDTDALVVKLDQQYKQLELSVAYLEKQVKELKEKEEVVEKLPDFISIAPKPSIAKIVLDYLLKEDGVCSLQKIKKVVKESRQDIKGQSIYSSLHWLAKQGKINRKNNGWYAVKEGK